MDAIFMAMKGAVSQGVIWGIMTIGVYLTYRVLDYADLTVEGSFALGGIVSAVLIMKDWDPLLSLLIATAAGMISGVVTGFLNTKLKIPAILSGILSMIALYSVNLIISQNKANVTLLKKDTVVSKFMDKFSFITDNGTASLLIGIIFCIIIIAVLYWFFGTEIGSIIRSTGNNEKMTKALGGNTDMMKIIALLLSNGLVALSGGLLAQSQGYADVGMGTGAIVIGLASVIIGEVIFGRRFSFAYKLFSVVMGSIVYRIIIAIVLQLGLKTYLLKLLTAIIVALALSIPVIKAKFFKPKFIPQADIVKEGE